MTTTPDEPLNDDEMLTDGPGGNPLPGQGESYGAGDGDGTDGDGTDGDGTDGDGTDGDGTDGDGTDGAGPAL